MVPDKIFVVERDSLCTKEAATLFQGQARTLFGQEGRDERDNSLDPDLGAWGRTTREIELHTAPLEILDQPLRCGIMNKNAVLCACVQLGKTLVGRSDGDAAKVLVACFHEDRKKTEITRFYANNV
jgi:hypothetical protein